MRVAQVIAVAGILLSRSALAEDSGGASVPAGRTIEVRLAAGYDPAAYRIVASLQTTTTPENWRIGIAADFVVAGAGDVPIEVVPATLHFNESVELDLGGRTSFSSGPVRPWLAAGAAAIVVNYSIQPNLPFTTDLPVNTQELAVGPWLGAGVDVRVASRAMIGLQFHYSTAHTHDLGSGLDVGAASAGISAGWTF